MTSAPPPPQQPNERMVEGVDAFGRRMQVPVSIWKAQVLPGLLQQVAGRPDQMAPLLLQAVRDGMAAEVLEPARQLCSSDPDVERGHAVLATVQREAGDLLAAQRTIEQLQQKKANVASAPVALAMIEQRRGNMAKVPDLLWQALAMDPNHADAVHWLLSLEKERGGDEAADAALERMMKAPRAWRAQLFAARRQLQLGNKDKAFVGYRMGAAHADGNPDALLMISGDLGQAGEHKLVAELVLPRFQVDRSPPQLCVNVLQYYVATRQHGPGKHLLHQTHMRFGPGIRQSLQPFTGAFDRLTPVPPPKPDQQVQFCHFNRPLWFSGLDEPMWALPDKPADGRLVVFAALTTEVKSEQTQVKQEDDIGRATRSMPLFLADHLHVASPLQVHALIPVLPGSGWVVSGKPWTPEMLVNLLPAELRDRALIVSGTVKADGDTRRFELWVHDCKEQRRIGEVQAEGDADDLGFIGRKLLGDLLPLLGAPPDAGLKVGRDAFWDSYIHGLGQASALVIGKQGLLPAVFGARDILGWLLQQVIDEPRWQPGKHLLGAALCLDHALQSPVHREFAGQFGELFRQEPPNTQFARLAVRPLRALGMLDLWRQRRDAIVQAATGETAYLEWLARQEK